MSFNILDAVKGYLTPDLISKAGSFLGESEGGISKALSGVVPSVLSGFVTKATKSTSDASDLLDIAKSSFSSTPASGISNLLGDGGGLLNKGLGLVQSLFGDKFSGIVSSIASFAGIKNSSASSLFSIAGPLVASVVGKHAVENNLGASGLSSFLSSQKTNILSALPAGLSGVTSLLGLSKIGDTVHNNVKSATKYVDETVDTAKRGSNWLLWLLLLALLGLLAWYFAGKGCNRAETTTTPTDTTTVKPAEPAVTAPTVKGTLDSTGNFVYDVGAEKEIKLADGTILKVGENSTEAKLYTMLSDASFSIDTVDKSKNWVAFDRVYFETGKSVLTAASQTQVKNIAAILKNFPNGSIKLGGYTDNTGDAAVNKRISESRAKIVASELVKLGAGAKQVVEAVGYGPEFPIADNATPEGRAQNRRVDLKVASK